MRGFATIAVDGIKTGANAGGVLRAAGCYGADLVIFAGRRLKKSELVTDTAKVWRHLPTLWADDVFDSMPIGSIPVAVDLIPGATPLHDFVHPQSAFYILGGEDRTLGTKVTSRCRHVVYVPTAYCMNLAATANVLLYDRCVKRGFPVNAPVTCGAGKDAP